MTPLEALDRTMLTSFVRDRYKKPGEIVSSQSTATRQALEQLTSDDMLQVRDETVQQLVDKPGYCRHGMRSTELCKVCGNYWEVFFA